MTYCRIVLGVALAACSVAAAAQTGSASPDSPRTPLPYDRGYDKDSPRTRAINDAERPAVQAANNAAAVEAADAAAATRSPQYEADLAAYDQALRDRRRVIATDRRIHARQQAAYADAMYAWRLQVAACDRGNRRACNAPTPDPAAFW